MKIAHVLGTFDHTGVSTVVFRISKTMADIGHDVEIIVWDDKNIPKLPDNVHVLKLKIFGLSRRPLIGKYFRQIHKRIFTEVIYNYLYAIVFSIFLERRLQRENFNQVFFHGTRYYPFYKIHIPHVVVAHNTKSLYLLNSSNYIINSICKYCLKSIYKNKTILTVSNGVRNDLINNFSADKSKTFCVYNPFNLNEIRKKSQDFIPNIESPNGYIVSIGRFCKQKRFDILLKAYALSRIKEHLVIVGSREKHFSKLRKLAADLKIDQKIHLIPYQDNVYPYIKHAKLLVVTSEYEGFGNTIVESLICGVPVVSTDCLSGPREILIGDLRKYLSNINDPKDIAVKIKNCLIDKPTIDLSYLSRFDDTVIAKKYLEHITN